MPRPSKPGTPRKADGTWRTEARTAQVELTVDLPVGQLDSDADGALTSDQSARIADYRSRIDAAGDGDEVKAIGDELKAELEQVEQHLEERGYTTLANAVRALITGEGWARLASLGCDDPLAATVELEARAANVQLPPTKLLDLGPLGSITIELDTSLGTAASPATYGFTAPFPTDSQPHGGSTVGLGTVLTSVDTSGSQLLLLPIGQVVSLVTSALGPVLDAVDTGVLAPALELLGADLGVVEGRVLDASCSSRTLVR